MTANLNTAEKAMLLSNEKLSAGVYAAQPQGFFADIVSCASVLEFEKKILFLKKAPGKWSENLWGIPCGTVDANDNDIYTTRARELKEEIGFKVQVSDLQCLGKLFIIQNEGVCNIHHVFYCEIHRDISIKLSAEHTDYKWLSKKEWSSVDFIPYQENVLSQFKIFAN